MNAKGYTSVHWIISTLAQYWLIWDYLQVWHKAILFFCCCCFVFCFCFCFCFVLFCFFFNTNLQEDRSFDRAGLNIPASLRPVTLSAISAAVPLSCHSYVKVCSPPIPELYSLVFNSFVSVSNASDLVDCSLFSCSTRSRRALTSSISVSSSATRLSSEERKRTPFLLRNPGL